jgi:hypothetical protein
MDRNRVRGHSSSISISGKGVLWSAPAFNMMDDRLCPRRVLYVTVRTLSLSLCRTHKVAFLKSAIEDKSHTSFSSLWKMASWFVVFVLIVDTEEEYRELKQMTEVSVLRRDKNFIEHISGCHYVQCQCNSSIHVYRYLNSYTTILHTI